VRKSDSAVALAMDAVFRRFNRQTVWLATGLLGSLILAATVVGVQLQKHQGEQVNLQVSADASGFDRPQTDEETNATTLGPNSDVGQPVIVFASSDAGHTPFTAPLSTSSRTLGVLTRHPGLGLFDQVIQ
jgi:hypothetical protein